jgi:hypothetical protein
MGPQKDTIVRLTGLTNIIHRELQGYQIGKFTREPEVGVIDLPIFGIRFKCTQTIRDDDINFRVISVTDENLFNKDSLFLELASSGYLRYIREKYSSHGYFVLLSYEKRGEKLLKAAKKKAKENKKGDFRVKYIESLLRRPFIEVYQEDPTIFDWILL